MNWEVQPFVSHPRKELSIHNFSHLPVASQQVMPKFHLIDAEDGDFDIVVFACDGVEKQIDGPASGDAPGTFQILQQARYFKRVLETLRGWNAVHS